MRHEWSIDEREVRRHVERRGRQHAFDLVAERTALIVVDLIPFFTDANPYARSIVRVVDRLADGVRNAGGAVAWVVPSDEPPNAARQELFGPDVGEMYRTSGGVGPVADRLAPGLTVGPGDIAVEKRGASAFFPGACDLGDLLRERGVDTVLIAGTIANVCCESSARDAVECGYRVVMAADANAARTDAELNATLHTIYRSFGDVRPTDDLLAELAGTPGPGARRAW